MQINADATNDENETMPLILSCKQRRAAKLNSRKAGTSGLSMTENCTTYDHMQDSKQVLPVSC